MGREVRRVPANWDHPKVMRTYGSRCEEGFQPMYDETFAAAAKRWKDDFAAWERGERPDWCSDENKSLEFWEWETSPPDRAYYRPWSDDEATWFQVWETVSEGTPVTPPFATPEELIDYLATHGDFWDQKRGHGAWPRANAERFVGTGWAPSMMVVTGGPDAGVYEARTGFPTAGAPQ